MFSWLFKRKPKPITREQRIARGWRDCNFCRGRGVYSNGYVRLGCHRCLNGLTTTDRENSAQDWEMHCGRYSYDPYNRRTPEEKAKIKAEGDAIMERYTAARAHDWDHDYFQKDVTNGLGH